ncbi:hypothetical protein ACFZDK_24680 [Streptomyces sp. NPDC007901]|uniref:hypothetical protein n=1 Tax=Streptomyces sp. NPDC007901 TaxID=3364785 RepID=UPI0036EF37F9
MAETIYVRGEGGGIHAMDLPLPEPIQERLTKGMLQRVNEDGSPYTAPADEEPTGVGKTPAPGQQVAGLPLTEPAKTANKPEWVGWAVVKGATPEEADGMTKADLIEKYGTPTSPSND